MDATTGLASGAVELRVKASPEWVGTVRLLVASAGRIFGVDEESLADLKMAVSEACSEALEKGSSEPLRVLLSGNADVMEVAVEAPGTAGGPGEEGGQPSLRTSVIEALFPDASFGDGSGPFKVHFSLPRNR